MTSSPNGTDRVDLSARSVSKTFGSVHALSDVDFDLSPGRVHALVGENGAGKSTFAKILAGIQPADSGTISINGVQTTVLDRAHAKTLGINMVPQQLSLVHDFSLVDNFLLGSRGIVADRARARALLRETLQRADVAVDIDIPTGRLSLAHRQLGEIVVALAEGARLLILDEPTASLGPHEVGGLFEHLRSLCEHGTSILLITHRLDEVGGVADDVTVLSRGRRVHSGPTAELDPGRIAHLMVGELPPARERVDREPGAPVLILDRVGAASDSDSALTDVSLTVHSGEVVGVAGVAGSGQNLLVDVIVGLADATAGTITLGGDRLARPVDLLSRGVAWIPENRADGIVPGMTVGANLGVYAAATDAAARGRVAARFPSRGAAAVTTRTALLNAFDVRPPLPGLGAALLSGGNQQKLLVARELDAAWADGATPTLVVAHGPTQGLDLRAAQAIRDRLVTAAERGAAVMVASHDLDELLGVCDRILVMVGGRIADDIPAEVATPERIGRAMAGIARTTSQEQS